MVLLRLSILLSWLALISCDSDSGSNESERRHRHRNHQSRQNYYPSGHYNNPAYPVSYGQPMYGVYPQPPIGYPYPGYQQPSQGYPYYGIQQVPVYSPPQSYGTYGGPQPAPGGYYPNPSGQQQMQQPPQPTPHYYPPHPYVPPAAAAPATSSSSSSSTTTVINGKSEKKNEEPSPSGTEYVYHPITDQRPGDIVYVLGPNGQPGSCGKSPCGK